MPALCLKKRKGFGRKRDMLTAQMANPAWQKPIPPFYYRKAAAQGKRVAIVGGGIASAQMAYALAQRGFDITLYCKDDSLAMGASQNRQGALYPLLHAGYDSLSEFYALAYAFAIRHYRQVLQSGFAYEHDFCGVQLLAWNDKHHKQLKGLADCEHWPEHMLQWQDSQTASHTAGIDLHCPALHFPDGGWINPSSLITALLDASAKQTSPVSTMPKHSDQSHPSPG